MYPTNNVLPTVVPVQPPPPPAMSHLKAELAPPVTSLLVTESVLPTASNGTIDLGIIGGKNSQLNYNSLDIAKMLSEEKISPFFVAGRRKRAELSSVDAAARKRTRVCVCVCCIYGVEIAAQVVRASASVVAAAALAWRGAENKREAAFKAEAKALLLLRRRRLRPYAPSFLLLFV